MNQNQIDQLLHEGLTFAYPLRPYRDTKIDTSFLDAEYHSTIGTWHRGIDLNGVGGGDTDLGWPVQSMFPGKVMEVDAQPGWGNTVLVTAEPWARDVVSSLLGVHLLVLDVQYAHLKQVTVREGMDLNAGDHLGSMGKADHDRYLAHLHLEVRCKSLPAIVRQGSDDAAKRVVLDTCIDPRVILDKVPLSDFGNTLGKGKRVAPTRLFTYNGDTQAGKSVSVVNRVMDKLFVRDGRGHMARPETVRAALKLAWTLLQHPHTE